MNIFYAVQATGNGHISRAIQLLPHLQKYGKVDIFLSGSNSSLACASAAFRSRGISFHYTMSGNIDYWRSLKELQPTRIYRDAMRLPLQKYDVIINDFDAVTALACKLKKISFLHAGHQASFNSENAPRPQKKNLAGELILKNYCRSDNNLGFHFLAYDDFIHPPVIKEEIKNAMLVNEGHICIYLPQYNDEHILKTFLNFSQRKFHVFSKSVSSVTKIKNINFFPVNNYSFNKSFISCDSIITGAGFETPSEALYLEKKLMCIPISGQYEQQCNAAALSDFNVFIQKSLFQENFEDAFFQWEKNGNQKKLPTICCNSKVAEAIIKASLRIKRIN